MDAYAIIRGLFTDAPGMLRMLSAHPELLELKTRIGETPLHHVAIEHRCDLVQSLLELGAQVDAREMSGNTPLIHAAALGHADLVALLLQHGADPHARNNCDETALLKAVHGEHRATYDLLIGYAADDVNRNINDWDAHDIVSNPVNTLHHDLIRRGLRDPFADAI